MSWDIIIGIIGLSLGFLLLIFGIIYSIWKRKKQSKNQTEKIKKGNKISDGK